MFSNGGLPWKPTVLCTIIAYGMNCILDLFVSYISVSDMYDEGNTDPSQ